MEISISYLPLIMLSVLAFWKENVILFMIVAGLSIMTGLYSPDFVDATSTTGLEISVALSLIVYSLLCSGYAFRLMFWNKEEV